VQALLSQFNSVPGVVGSMLCDKEGHVLADLFPPRIDRSAPARAAQLLADKASGLETIGGPVGLLTLRFAEARLVVKPLAGGNLLVVCAPSANPQPLAILAATIAPKLEKLVAARAQTRAAPAVDLGEQLFPAEPAAQARPAPGRLFQTVQRIDLAIARRKLDPFRTRGAIVLKAGFGLGCIDQDTPDDATMLSKLEAAAFAVLGEKV
jgi:predicted regulator of Ras-like GTPase activity (Roadblock/LC7/MglB family)